MMAPDVAVILVVPTARALARLEADIDAVTLELLTQVTLELISRVNESEKVPVAVNCWLLPFAIDGLTGVTVIPVSKAAVTLRVV